MATNHPFYVHCRLTLDSVITSDWEKKANRKYRLAVDTTLPQSSELAVLDSKGESKVLQGACGIDSVSTTENFGGDTATVSLVLGSEIALALKSRLACQDNLRIEFNTTGTWELAFDGFIGAQAWTKVSTPDGASYRLEMQAEGLIKLLSQAWLNWQGAVQPQKDKILLTASTFYADISMRANRETPTELVKSLLTFGISGLLEFELDGKTMKPGEATSWWQFGNEADGNWNTIDELAQANTNLWFMRAQGPLWGLIQGLAEPDLHELFTTYAFGENADSGVLPTIIFRPRPFPGAEGDDAGWTGLKMVLLGLNPGKGCLQVSAQRSDNGASNVFHWASTGASDTTYSSFAGKMALGFFADQSLIKRWGFQARQMTTQLFSRTGDWFKTGAKKALERYAWQEMPMPFFWQQTRHYLLQPQCHIGTVLEDYTDGKDGKPEVCGYITSVSHQFSAEPYSARTTLGVSRCIEGVTKEDYPKAARAFVTMSQMAYVIPTGEQASKDTPTTVDGTAPIQPTPVGDRIKPVAFSAPAHPFGEQRPGNPHAGIDIDVGSGTPVKATITGRVLPGSAGVGENLRSGNYLRITGEGGMVHIFCHLASQPTSLSGKVVKVGDVVAQSGATGVYQGKPVRPHLHWAIKVNGVPKNPMDWLAGK